MANVISILMFLMSGFLLFLGYVVISHHNNLSAKCFLGLMISTAIYCFCYGLQVSSSSLEANLLILKFEYIGILFFPVFYFMLVLTYISKNRKKLSYIFLVLVLLNLIFEILYCTNSFHHFIYKKTWLDLSGEIPVFKADYNYGFFYIGFLFFLAVTGFFLYAISYWGKAHLYKKQIFFLLVGSLFPTIASILYYIGFDFYHINVVPLSFCFAAVFFMISIFQYNFLDVMPIAKEYVYDSLNSGLIVLDTQNHLIDYNHNALALFPFFSSRLIGQDLASLLKEDQQLVETLFEENEFGFQEIERTINGELHAFKFTISDVKKNEDVVGKIIVINDITEYHRLLKKLDLLASTDGLTGIYNRRHFMNLAKFEVDKALRYQHNLSLLMLDIDLFKKINDTYGHLVGDQTLKFVVQKIKNNIREIDLFGRYGGEEFVILLSEADLKNARIVAERIRTDIAGEKFVVEDQEISVSVSIGFTSLKKNNSLSDLDSLLKQADNALYQAKETGRNKVVAG